MSDPTLRPRLLPGHARPRERAIAAADAAVDDVSAEPIRLAGSPDIGEVPARHLPARAQFRSVDVWDPLWPDAVQRAAIRAAPIVHRHKGTVYAVKTALAALGMDAEVREWWQETPRGEPYTFTVRAFARARLYDGPLLDVRLIRVAYASVLRAKPESRLFDLTVTATLPATLGLAPVGLARLRVQRAACVRVRTGLTRGLGLAPIGVPRFRIALAGAPVLPRGAT